MACATRFASRVKTRSPFLFFPLLLHPIIHPPLLPCPLPLISPFPSSLPKSYLQNRSLTSLESSPTAPLSDSSSDYETDEAELPHSSDHNLDGFLQILSKTKEISSYEGFFAFLDESGVQPTAGLVYEAMRAVRSDWKLALRVFNWGEKCGCNGVGAWNLMVWILGKQRRFDVAWRLVREMHLLAMAPRQALLIMMKRCAGLLSTRMGFLRTGKSEPTLTPFLFLCVVSRYAAANEAGKAIRTFQAMDKFKIMADAAAFYTLLHALCKHKNIEEAEELMFLNRKFFPLETEGFNIILNGWCNIMTDQVEAKRVWREMSNCCITPDGTSYTHMICCFSKVGNLFDSLRLYDEMKKRGWVPSLVVYNSVIYVLMRENCIKEACNLLPKIIDMGIKPDVDTYNSIIYPLCEAKKLEEARIIFDEMVEKGLSPNVETYHAFAMVEDIEGTLNLINRMRDVGCGPNSSTFVIVLDKFFRWGLAENALRIWVEMRKHNVATNSQHYIMLVQGLAACGWPYKAWDFYKEMKFMGFPDNPKVEKLLFKQMEEIDKNHKKGKQRHGMGDTHVVHRKANATGMKAWEHMQEIENMSRYFRK
ncbi:hypothetical protein ACLOJK_000041 [Asimina triloba]